MLTTMDVTAPNECWTPQMMTRGWSRPPKERSPAMRSAFMNFACEPDAAKVDWTRKLTERGMFS